MASRSVQPFCTDDHRLHRVSLYIAMGRSFPLKMAPSHAGSGPHLIRGSLVHPNHQPKRHIDWFSHFCRAHYCDRKTDHATQSVTIGHIYVHSTAMRPNDTWLCTIKSHIHTQDACTYNRRPHWTSCKYSNVDRHPCTDQKG